MERPPPPLDPNDKLPPQPPALDDTRAGPPLAPREPRRRARRWWLALPIALFVYLLLALVTLAQPVSVAGLSLTVPIPGLPPERIFGLPERPFTIAIVGLDIRPAQNGPSRTDSILLLRVDAARDRAGILSIPRDTLVQIPSDDGAFQDRINTAFLEGFSPDEPDLGPAALAGTIEHNLGIEIDYYMVFDQRDAADLLVAAGVTP
ncbi:MAG: LCP family protein [Dehalococcoidia bacterium]|nr:LCP family protein [Dehalococcoidia bacterium]